MRKPLRFFGVTAAAALAAGAVLPLVSSTGAQAARFTGGDLVVYRVGNGAGALTNAASKVFLRAQAGARPRCRTTTPWLTWGPCTWQRPSTRLSLRQGLVPLTAAGIRSSDRMSLDEN